ncbi:MAG: YdhR family protein [Pseudolabrys sp.]
MMTAVVTIKLPAGLTREQWLENTKKIAARFQNIPGLIRKQFLYSDRGVGGGVYLWETREAAEACYRGSWRDNIRNMFGVEPEITWFESPVVVDNESHEIKIAA